MTTKAYFSGRSVYFEKLIRQLRLLEIFRNRALGRIKSSEDEQQAYEIAQALRNLITSVYNEFSEQSVVRLQQDLKKLQLQDYLRYAYYYLFALVQRYALFGDIQRIVNETYYIYKCEIIDYQPATDKFDSLSVAIYSLKKDRFMVSNYWRGFTIMESLKKMDYAQRKQNVEQFMQIEEDLKDGGLYQFS